MIRIEGMATTGSPSEHPGALPEAEEYTADYGRTRLVALHVPSDEGGMSVVHVYSVVNVTTHPELRERALAGLLHMLPSGAIAMPFVYHDPSARKLALVVPHVLRHEVARERARFLSRIAADPSTPVAAYALEATVVVGELELRRYLGLTPKPANGHSREASRPTDAVPETIEAIPVESGRSNGRSTYPPPLPGEARDVSDDIEGPGTSPGTIPGTQRAANRLRARLASNRALSEEVESIIEADEVEELPSIDDVPDEVTGLTAMAALANESYEQDLLQGGKTMIAPAADDDDDDEHDGEPSTARRISAVSMRPPPAFDDPATEMAVQLNDSVVLFVRLEVGFEDRFRDGVHDLLVQLTEVDGFPVVLLTLVEGRDTVPYVRRAALDPSRSEHRAILESLRRDFVAMVAVYGPDNQLVRVFELTAPRAVNVAMVLERVGRFAVTPIDPKAALAGALKEPPPVRERHPFDREEGTALTSARETWGALEQLAQWTAPDRMERALLVLSVPRDVIDISMQTVTSSAVEFGLALPGALAQRAVALGVAADASELVSVQLHRFLHTVGDPSRGGLTVEQVATNWERLLDAAATHEVVVDPTTHEIAWRAIRTVRQSTLPPLFDNIDLANLPEVAAPQLVLLLEHPRARREAALEVCRRADPAMLDALYRAVRKMPRNDVVRIVPRVIGFGEAAGDVLLDGLGARKTFVRQASALALGELKLRRGVFPLVHLLQTEPSDIWREVARVIGTFGAAALRSVTRGLRDPKGSEERFAWALAHLANHGCERAVSRLSHDRDEKLAAMAEEAMLLRDVALRQESVVRGRGEAKVDEPVEEFSRRFYEVLEGKAPDRDLEDVVD